MANSPVNSASAQHDLTRLTFEDGLQTDPTFSPDGRFVAYSSNRAGNFDIWVQPVAAGDAVQVTKSPAHDLEPSWSPDGSTIAFRSERDGGGVYLVPALGGPERLLVRSGTHPAWSADGMHIRYLVRAFDEAKLYVVALTGHPPREIFSEVTASGSWNWIWPHPDGRMSFLGVHKKLGFGFYTASPSGTIASSNLTRLPAQISDMVHGGGQRFYWTHRGTELFLETAADNGVQNLWKVRVDPSTLAWLSAERLTTGARRGRRLGSFNRWQAPGVQHATPFPTRLAIHIRSGQAPPVGWSSADRGRRGRTYTRCGWRWTVDRL